MQTESTSDRILYLSTWTENYVVKVLSQVDVFFGGSSVCAATAQQAPKSTQKRIHLRAPSASVHL